MVGHGEQRVIRGTRRRSAALRPFLNGVTLAGIATLSLTAAPLAAATPPAASTTVEAGGRAAVPPAPVFTPMPRPRIVIDPIPYGLDRRAQMAAYSKRHYGVYQWWLMPKQIVLHYTVSNTYKSAWWEWAAPGIPYYVYGEYPRPAAHFVVDQDGTIYNTVSTQLRVRNAVGLNHIAIGIEFVEMRSATAILARHKQRAAGAALVRWLQYQYRIRNTDVIGHGMANQSRFFLDLTGRKNNHVDWSPKETAVFRTLLKAP